MGNDQQDSIERVWTPSQMPEWSPVVEIALGGLAARERVVLGLDVDPQRCRFCGNAKGTVSFENEAHAIPIALGNRSVVSLEECDRCNAKYSQEIENDLVNFLGPLRTFCGIRGRRKVPTFRRSNSSAPIRRAANQVIATEEDNTLKIHHGSDGQSATIDVEYPPFDLANVGRAFARMALFHLGTGETSSFHHILQWVRGDREWLPNVYQIVSPGGVSDAGLFWILAPPLEHREHTFIVCLVFSCLAYFLPLPAQDWTVRDPPWASVLQPFVDLWGATGSVTRFQANEAGRVEGYRVRWALGKQQ